jgi:hypothetical protein
VTSYLNCWRSGTEESMAMWDLYGKGNRTIAIKSTIGRLKEIIAPLGYPVYIGEVKYVDWHDAPFDNNVLAMCARKSLSYRHESEVRILIWSELIRSPSSTVANTDQSGIVSLSGLETRVALGLSIPVDLGRLISEIIVGPRDPTWVGILARDVLRRYGLEKNLVISDLLEPRIPT